MRFASSSGLALSLALLGVSGCGDEAPPPPATRAVTIPVEARVGSELFACGRTYSKVGTSGASYEPMDFRVYVHAVRLVSDSGQEVPVALTNDGTWQRDGVALLDFANKDGLCANGTAGMNATLKGTVPEGHYTGLRFTLGVPESLNHGDATTSAAPLGDSTLFWNWRGGYVFARIDGRTGGVPTGYYMHLGSTDCAPPPAGQTSGTAGCAHENRVEVRLEGFTLGSSKVVMDLAALFADSNLDTNAAVPNTAGGCMSQQEDPDCAPVFARLGLAFGDLAANPAGQRFIRAE
ncbi:metallo-mystery pair system four-Cys motif protein [Corallococcus sp. H22C18031201]|uniref:MbnP family copper-binding protein n=1 Tax=Citreicoccus inhibens TaxID=2849499 RepID=UPI000E73C536|nr:MbnP family copper-binding protein [Citreicoccus inhibens]MBU8899630.1 metallo-mystery pair system four-Cys motif protein [Citreicoccus inhibens]RJS27389.1 metallo-mystery pair system four-Cys motif protein [Corallococcus sp. H22C18031201]